MMILALACLLLSPIQDVTSKAVEIALRKSQDGTVTGLVLKQGGRETPGKKIK